MTQTPVAPVDTTPAVEETQEARVNYADLSMFNGECRVFNIKKMKNKDGSEFVVASFIQNLPDAKKGLSETAMVLEVLTSGNIMNMYNQGWLPNGRRVTLIGEIQEIRSHYVDQQGNVRVLKNPVMKLNGYQTLVRLGAKPKSMQVTVAGQESQTI